MEILKVSSKSNPNSVAGAIAEMIKRNRKVELQAIGAGAINQAVKAIAIARGYAQDYQLFILDEPSSALDPIAEAKVYDNMLELGKNKTLIFISHRLTTTVNADKIYLFEYGKIIEQGTHKQLMELNGQYKKMFDSQAIKYLGGDYNA